MELPDKELDHNPFANAAIGERYEAYVPDTLDLADRMGLAINALSNLWIPDQNWAINHLVDFSRRPAVLFPNDTGALDAYLNLPPKIVEALALCRLGSGNKSDLATDEGALRSQLKRVGKDGLLYCPTEGLAEFRDDRGYACAYSEGRHLLDMVILAQLDDDPIWGEIGRRKVERLMSLTKEKEGFRYFWRPTFKLNEIPPSDSVESIPWDIANAACVAYASALFHQTTGCDSALVLSKGLAHYALARLYNNQDGHYNTYHFHGSTVGLLGVCQYGIAVGDREALERVNACFRWARSQGDSLIGFFPEYMPGSRQYMAREKDGNTAEMCEVADMVLLALKLTRAGIGDYWEDVDRWVRNVYAEAQVCDAGFFERLPDSYFNKEPLQVAKVPSSYLDTRDVPKRMVGGFFGWMRANDGLPVRQTPTGPRIVCDFDPQQLSIMSCCCGNASRTLFYIWDSIVTRQDDEVQVNLLLNRASRWLDVDSYLPVEGKVVLHIKEAPKVAVRMPEWCDPHQVNVVVGKQRGTFNTEGRCLRLSGLEKGSQVTLTFPVPNREVERVIGDLPYKLRLRGSNVVGIDPRGLACPLYENQPTGRLVKKTRFIPGIRKVMW